MVGSGDLHPARSAELKEVVLVVKGRFWVHGGPAVPLPCSAAWVMLEDNTLCKRICWEVGSSWVMAPAELGTGVISGQEQREKREKERPQLGTGKQK